MVSIHFFQLALILQFGFNNHFFSRKIALEIAPWSSADCILAIRMGQSGHTKGRLIYCAGNFSNGKLVIIIDFNSTCTCIPNDILTLICSLLLIRIGFELMISFPLLSCSLLGRPQTDCKTNSI